MKENKRKLTNLFTEVIYFSTPNGDEKGKTRIRRTEAERLGEVDESKLGTRQGSLRKKD